MPVTPLRSAESTSSSIRAACACVAQVVAEALEVEAELLGVAAQVAGSQLVLVVEQQVVHLPERALGGRRLGGLGGELGVRVDVGERQVAPDVADVAEVGEQLADDRLGPAAVGALEVAVLDHASPAPRPGRGGGRARDRPATARSTSGSERPSRARIARRGGQQRGDAEDQPGEGRGAERGARARRASPPRSSAPSKARVAISRETVKPIPAIVPPPAVGRPADRRAQPAPAQPRHQPGDAGDADRLAEHVAEEDPERDRRGEGPRRGSRRRSRCRRWPARTAARSRSSSTGGRAAAAGRSARPPRRRPARAERASSGVGCSRNARKRSGRPLQLAAARRVGAGDQADGEAEDDGIDARLEQRHPGRRGEQPT